MNGQNSAVVLQTTAVKMVLILRYPGEMATLFSMPQILLPRLTPLLPRRQQPAADADADAHGGNNIDKQAKLGIGLGVGLGVPLLGSIAAAIFLWQRSLSRARSEVSDRDDVCSSDQMAKGASPDPGYRYGEDADPAATATGTPGREAELDGDAAIYQLEAERNMRSELGDRCIYELL